MARILGKALVELQASLVQEDQEIVEENNKEEKKVVKKDENLGCEKCDYVAPNRMLLGKHKKAHEREEAKGKE